MAIPLVIASGSRSQAMPARSGTATYWPAEFEIDTRSAKLTGHVVIADESGKGIRQAIYGARLPELMSTAVDGSSSTGSRAPARSSTERSFGLAIPESAIINNLEPVRRSE